MTLDRPNVRGSDCPSESPCPTPSPSPSPYSPSDFWSPSSVSQEEGGGLRDEMMTATRHEGLDPQCIGYAWTSGCGRVATITVASLIPCMIPRRPLMDLCDRCWSAMGQTRHGCCERHYPDGSKTRDQSFVVAPGWGPTS